MKHTLLGIVATGLILATSCSTPKDITYFQDMTAGKVVTTENIANIRIKPEDKLAITVSTQDPALSAMFNLTQVQNRMQPTTQSTRTSGSNVNSSSNNVSLYTVNEKGDINFPVLGTLHIAGMTRFELSDYISSQLISRNLVKDPIVTVEFANTGITILGQVSSPGRYEFNKDRLNIVDAIAMAGDLQINGKRQDILVMREEPDGSTKAYRVNLLDMDELAASPVYYIQQNDIVYVEPNDKVKRSTTPTGDTPFTPTFWMSVGSFALTITSLIISLTR